MTMLQQNDVNAYLIVEQNRRWSDVFRLPKDRPTLIGRSSACQIVIQDDRSSRHHAQIDWRNGKWIIRDLGSRNGTAVDGETIQGERELANDSKLQIAGSTYRFTQSLRSVSADSSLLLSQSDRPDRAATADLTDQTQPTPLIIQRSEPRRLIAELAMQISLAPNVSAAAEVVLESLLKQCSIQAGAILAIDSAGITRLLATRERQGKAYHRMSDFLLQSCLSEQRSFLARNIQDDRNLVEAGTSLSADSQSVICVPILEAKQVVGIIHLYARTDEADLTPTHLELTSAAAEVLAVSFNYLRQRNRLEKKLQQSRRITAGLQQQLAESNSSDTMLGQSANLKQLQNQIARVAITEANVLLRGESGVGKELAARNIHNLSMRKSKPFIAVNCAALTSSLLESELFGHERGAFTGATEQKMGKFEMANGGTLMLDEVGEMSAEIQAKFLRVLEGQPFERVGGSKSISVDVRIVAATNRDLEQAVEANTFRADLYFRLRVVELYVPSLRDRREDIISLAESFMTSFRRRSGIGPIGFSQRAIDAMLAYDWPGNIRELKNSVERAFVLANSELAEPEDLALSNLGGSSLPVARQVATAAGYREMTLADVERAHILATLEYTAGQKSKASTILGIERSTLDRKLKKFDGDDSE
jgi:transcriptional regulator with GAF, ATPase, and Fis domain